MRGRGTLCYMPGGHFCVAVLFYWPFRQFATVEWQVCSRTVALNLHDPPGRNSSARAITAHRVPHCATPTADAATTLVVWSAIGSSTHRGGYPSQSTLSSIANKSSFFGDWWPLWDETSSNFRLLAYRRELGSISCLLCLLTLISWSFHSIPLSVCIPFHQPAFSRTLSQLTKAATIQRLSCKHTIPSASCKMSATRGSASAHTRSRQDSTYPLRIKLSRH